MSSLDALREFDAAAASAFADAGPLADRATYSDSAVTDVDVTVMIDRDVQRFGQYNQVIGTQTQIGLQLSQVTPQQGGTVTAGSETFKLDRQVEGDNSWDWWAVTPA